MGKRQFKTESKKLLDMMIHSIYTNKEIFLRELISNASDAIDKRYLCALSDEKLRLGVGEEYEIRLTVDKDARTLTISDNGIGMSEEELENNLGVIAKSGSLDFKTKEENKNENIDVIGQFGVGFYSAFMIADTIQVISKSADGPAHKWESFGVDGYTIKEAEREKIGSDIVLHLREDSEEEKYSDFLEEYRLRALISKYSDYIRYPIKMLISKQQLCEGSETEYETVIEDAVLNSITPIWKRKEKDVKEEDYNSFYMSKFHDFSAPVKTIKQSVEGAVSYDALLFIPGRAPFDYYTREYEKGLQLYSSSVMIMDKCGDLLPDYFSFVKGVVDSPDLSLNISREILQQDRQLKVIAKNLENKIAKSLGELLNKDREKYLQFFKAFGTQLKYGLYSDYGMHKDLLKDLVLFDSTFEDKETALKEYCLRMKDGQEKIYYACGETLAQIKALPQVEAALSHGLEVLCLTHEIDEFALQMMGSYGEKNFSFANVCSEGADFASEEEKEDLKKKNEDQKDLLDFIKDSIGEVSSVKFTANLKDHAACISNEGMLSASMEKTLSMMPGMEEPMKAELVLEINMNHAVAEKLKNLFETDKETLGKYSKLLYNQARLVSGLSVDNAAEFSKLISDLMVK